MRPLAVPWAAGLDLLGRSARRAMRAGAAAHAMAVRHGDGGVEEASRVADRAGELAAPGAGQRVLHQLVGRIGRVVGLVGDEGAREAPEGRRQLFDVIPQRHMHVRSMSRVAPHMILGQRQSLAYGAFPRFHDVHP